MPTCAEVLVRTLRDAGVTRMFGLEDTPLCKR